MGQIQAFILPIGLLAMFYFFAIRPQRKKEKEIKAMRSSLRVGDDVVTIGGLHGKISKVKEDVLILESGSAKTKLEVTRWAIGSVTNGNNKIDYKDE